MFCRSVLLLAVTPGGGEGGEGGGGEGLLYEKVGDAPREFSFWPLRGTKKGVVQAFFDP